VSAAQATRERLGDGTSLVRLRLRFGREGLHYTRGGSLIGRPWVRLTFEAGRNGTVYWLAPTVEFCRGTRVL
jgi:hypothetical protein